MTPRPGFLRTDRPAAPACLAPCSFHARRPAASVGPTPPASRTPRPLPDRSAPPVRERRSHDPAPASMLFVRHAAWWRSAEVATAHALGRIGPTPTALPGGAVRPCGAGLESRRQLGRPSSAPDPVPADNAYAPARGDGQQASRCRGRGSAAVPVRRIPRVPSPFSPGRRGLVVCQRI